MKELVQKIFDCGITMCDSKRFDMFLRNFDVWSQVEGDIVECGVWKGGMSIFLSKLFDKKTVWVCDSFNGFQPLPEAKYQYTKRIERHDPEIFSKNYPVEFRISLEEVRQNFEKFGLANDPRIKFLKGWVKDTLPSADIQKIAILRVDVDSYSATREVLDCLYDKVQPGGVIIFDDTELWESMDAIRDFFYERKIPIFLRNPETDLISYVESTGESYPLPAGSYFIKPI